ncbi:MAG TPA: HAD-IA family hydrolase [Solirubrobacteraceae bacterium]
MTPRAVLLDALGTLLELEPPAPLLVRELAAGGVEVSEEEAWAALREEIAYYRAHHDIARDERGLAVLRERCTAVLRDALPAHARDAPDLQGALLAALRFRPYPEVHEALGALRRGGARLVVVSNWDVSLHHALAETALSPLVDAAISSAEAGARKPDPAIFERALALAGVRAQDALHVGDSLDADVEGARAAGIEPVLVVRDGSAPPPGVRAIASLSSLIER